VALGEAHDIEPVPGLPLAELRATRGNVSTSFS